MTMPSFTCVRCSASFARRCPVGRRPIYCGRSCRQRAYEARRRGACHFRLPTPQHPLPRPARLLGLYEAGRRWGRRHALRPDGPRNSEGHRPTLCGTHALVASAQRFGAPGAQLGEDCRTCARIARAYPLVEPLDPGGDLAELKHQLLAAHGATTAAEGREPGPTDSRRPS